jgi:hypothetical protein
MTQATAGQRFRMPIRYGPWLDRYHLEAEANPNEFTWRTLGLSVEVEPEVVVFRRDRLECSIYGVCAGGAGFTLVDVDVPGVNEWFDTIGRRWRIELGARVRTGAFAAGVFYFLRGNRFDESDSTSAAGTRLRVPEVFTQDHGVGFAIGVRI